MALIQSKKAVTSGGGSSINVTFDSAVTRGNFIAVGVSTGVGAINSVTDSVGNTYVRAVRHATYSYADIWYCKNALGGSSFQVTASFASSTHSVIFIEEWSNIWNVGEPLDQTAGASGDGATPNTPTVTTGATTFAKELVLVSGGYFLGSGENNFSVGAGYSNFLSDNSLPTSGQTVEAGFESKEVSSTGAQTGTFGLASNATTWEVVIATFKLSTQTTATFTMDAVISETTSSAVYSLGNIVLPRPKSFDREQIYMKKDVLSLSGKTGRDITGRKERFILSWDKMSKTEFDTLLSAIETNVAMTFSISDGVLQIAETDVFAVVSGAEYSTLGSDYLVSTELVLTEVT